MVKINPKARDLVSCRNMVNKNPSFGVFYGENPLKAPFPLLLLEMSLVIVISRLVRLLLKPLKQPRVVSDVIVSLFLSLPFFFLYDFSFPWDRGIIISSSLAFLSNEEEYDDDDH